MNRTKIGIMHSLRPKRLVNDHNRLAKLYGAVEDTRLRFFGYE